MSLVMRIMTNLYPKKTDFTSVTDDKIAAIQNNLNNRSRKSLGFLTPNEVISKYLNRVNRKIVSTFHW